MKRTPLLVLLALLSPAPTEPARADDDGLLTRTYDVAPLVTAAPEPEVLVLGLPPAGLAFRPEEEDADEPAAYLPADALVELLLTSVPGPWEDDDRTVVGVEGEKLVVRADAATQAAVERFLGRLWNDAMVRVALEGRHLVFDATSRARLAEQGLLDVLASGRVGSRSVAALVEAATASSAAAATVRPGQRGTLGRVESTTYVRDYDVEIAQDSAVGDPVVDALASGWLLDVRPYRLQDGSLLLEVLGQAVEPERPLRREALEVEPLGTVDLPACRALRFAGNARIVSGGAVAWTAAPAGEGGPLEVVLLSARLVGEAPARETPRRYDVAALAAMPFGWRLTHEPPFVQGALDAGALNPPRFVRIEPEHPVAAPEELLEEILERTGPDLWERDGAWMTSVDRALLASHDEAVLDDVGEILREREGALDARRLRVRLLAVAADETVEVLADAGLDCPLDLSVAWLCGVERAYVADWDVEVAQEARAGDPQIGTAFGGLALEARLEPARQAGAFALGVALSYTDLDPVMETRRLHNECTGAVDVPRLTRRDVQQQIVLLTGATQRLDAGTLDDGRRLVVEVTLAR